MSERCVTEVGQSLLHTKRLTDVEDHVQVRVLKAGVVVGARFVRVLVRRVRDLGEFV